MLGHPTQYRRQTYLMNQLKIIRSQGFLVMMDNHIRLRKIKIHKTPYKNNGHAKPKRIDFDNPETKRTKLSMSKENGFDGFKSDVRRDDEPINFNELRIRQSSRDFVMAAFVL